MSHSWKWKSLSCVWLFATPWTVAHQAPLSMGILQATILEWVATPFSGDLTDPGIKLGSPSLQVDSLPAELPGKPNLDFSSMLFAGKQELQWRRQWHPTPEFMPGKSHGWRSLVGCSPWGRKESDTTETSLSLFTFMHWRRKWQPTPVFLPGESQGRGSLVGCHLWGHTESDTTELT